MDESWVGMRLWDNYVVGRRILGRRWNGLYIGTRVRDEHRVLVAMSQRHPPDLARFNTLIGRDVPGIAQALDVGEMSEKDGYASGAAFVESLEDLPLELVATDPMPAVASIRFAAKLCSMLADGCQSNLPHHDICPLTIHVRRAEMGLVPTRVSIFALDFLRSAVSTCVGFVPPILEPYDSPECLRRVATDGRAHTFTVAAVLSRLLIGRYPFVGCHYDEYANSILAQHTLPLGADLWAKEMVRIGLETRVAARPSLPDYLSLLQNAIEHMSATRM